MRDPTVPRCDVLVVGGGAAGLTAAAYAAEAGAATLVVERNARMARKVMITGKGRCNLTNACDRDAFLTRVVRNPRFLYSALAALSPQDMMERIETAGVPLKIERGDRVFPVSDRAVDIVDALVRLANRAGARFAQGRIVSLAPAGSGWRLTDDCGTAYTASTVIVATGGLSYPATGSTGDGYDLARQTGHTVTDTQPSLVPWETAEAYVPLLQGLTLKNVALTLTDTATGKPVFREQGELLFTHFGLSGPLALSASAHMRPFAPGRYTAAVNCKPALSADQLDERLVRDLAANANRDFANSLSALLPHSLIPVAVELSGIPAHLKCHQITRVQRQQLGRLLQALPLTVTRLRPYEEAVVTAGGVAVGEVDPRTLQSKRCPGLFWAGEVLDVDAYTGGFNLQIAFSTGALAGRAAADAALSKQHNG